MKKYKRHEYKKRRIPLRLHRGQKAVWIWYWGADKEWGRLFCAVRTPENPHWCIRGTRMRGGYKGFDWERNRWVVRPWNDGPKKRIKAGWRYKVYG